jgi:hypothetical protein
MRTPVTLPPSSDGIEHAMNIRRSFKQSQSNDLPFRVIVIVGGSIPVALAALLLFGK